MRNPWSEYHAVRGGRPRPWPGRLFICPNVESHQLGNRRDVLLWLPEQAEKDAGPFPTLYLHDAQNLFDPETAFGGEPWDASQALNDLANRGSAVIAVGVSHHGKDRIAEYTPFQDPKWGGGKGDSYLDFLTETVRPLVDEHFPTLRSPQHTGLLGSSLGGLISLYGLFERPEVFGLCGALSPSMHFAQAATEAYLRRLPTHVTAPEGRRIYLDVGTRERLPPDAPNRWFHYGSWRYRRDVVRVAAVLRRRGFQNGRNLLYREERGGRHHEAAWRRRLPMALDFLFRPTHGL